MKVDLAPFEGDGGVANLSRTVLKLAGQIDGGIQKYGLGDGGAAYAYEADGYGNTYFMDDANVPSLLSLPYLGYLKADDRVYANTRAKVPPSKPPPPPPPPRARQFGSLSLPVAFSCVCAVDNTGLWVIGLSIIVLRRLLYLCLGSVRGQPMVLQRRGRGRHRRASQPSQPRPHFECACCPGSVGCVSVQCPRTMRGPGGCGEEKQNRWRRDSH